MKASISSSVAALFVTLAFSTSGAAMQCPTGYYRSGSYCLPNAGARPGPAIPRVGTCPTDYHPSGDFCLGNRSAKPAVIRTGSCPAGYHASGDYCLRSR